MSKSLFLTILISAVTLSACTKKTQDQISSAGHEATAKVSNDLAFKSALNLYALKANDGQDLSSGPCLGSVAPDWVADIAHNPRQEIDEKPENQCADFLNGRAHHFIELDPEGKLIRSY